MSLSTTYTSSHAILLCLAVRPASGLDDRPHLPPINEHIDRTHNLCTLTLHQTQQLHGRRGAFRVVLDAPGDRVGRCDVYGCQGSDDILRAVWLPVDEDLQGEMLVEGMLRVIHHREWVVPSGMRFEGFTEIRLVGQVQE